MTTDQYRHLALSFHGVEEVPHFDHPSFRYKGKIFATLWEKENRAMLKLSPEDQSVFCAYDKQTFFPVAGSWGKKGATFVELSGVREDMFMDALATAYDALANKSKKRKPGL